MDVKEASEMFKALSDPNRLVALNMINGSEICACMILEALNITQPTLSHHMKILHKAGLVNIRQEGKWSYYSINPESMEKISLYLNDLKAGTCPIAHEDDE